MATLFLFLLAFPCGWSASLLWVNPRPTRTTAATNTAFPCGGQKTPPNPLFSYYSPDQLNMTWTQTGPYNNTNTTWYIHRFDLDGNLTSTTVYQQDLISPNPNITSYTRFFPLPSNFACDLRIERCALAIRMNSSFPTLSYTTCADVAIFDRKNDLRIVVTVNLPSGETPLDPANFLGRFFDIYGPGKTIPLGFSTESMNLTTDSFKVSNGQYKIIMDISDWLFVTVNGQTRTYQGFFYAAEMAAGLKDQPDGLASVVSPHTIAQIQFAPRSEFGGGGGGGGAGRTVVAIAVILLIITGTATLIVFFLKRFRPESYEKLTKSCDPKL